MKRVTEKVKDIVEICPFTHLDDFAADPGLTLAGYHFTDITADLMSKWLDQVVDVQSGKGASLALAGFRGVGKSHFLAVLAAIISRPELRGGISDRHVASSADRLSRRHGGVAFVRRGTGTSLQDELKRAVGAAFGINPTTLNDSLYNLLLNAAGQAGDQPLVILIDTALGRGSRVERDDGNVLSEIASAAKEIGIFVGVALDDDISGADGPNSSISNDFSIDYLDQEHLYKIVDTHIFSKHNHMLPVLREIFDYYRAMLPGFRWSEQRFTSLYPLHPATLEIAPLIRLYIHDFALLGFASEAGVKILGRPANSLIGLDEVFDSVENKLRSTDDLAEAFAVFDKIEREVISKSPVQFRHTAKLILKGLLMLSLNGQGATASEIGASMMVFAEDGGGSMGPDVVALLDSFANTFPDSVEKTGGEGVEVNYCLRLSEPLDIESILAESIKDVSYEAIWKILLRVTAEKFADFGGAQNIGISISHCIVNWRGSIRRGEIQWEPQDIATRSSENKEIPDWTVQVLHNRKPKGTEATDARGEPIVWNIAPLTAAENETIAKFYLLTTDADIRGQFGDGLATVVHVQSIAVDKVWQRVFFENGSLGADGAEYQFTHEALSAHSLTHVFGQMLEPVFDLRYPGHPLFSEVLGVKEVSTLIARFFGGSGLNNPETQRLAELFAFPLGLAAPQADILVPAPVEQLTELDFARLVDFESDSKSTGVRPLADISASLAASPLGLSREAQHLVLAAFVAHRKYEFVTSNGNRINHRSLDLQIIWDDIIGLAKPLNEQFAPERLLSWAKLITCNPALRSLERSEDRLLIIDSLAHWLNNWNESRSIADFDALPDENLNAGIWRTAANLRKSFGAMAATIGSLIENDITLDECLQSVADLFSDLESEYEDKKAGLSVLKEFTTSVVTRSSVAGYMSQCEMTDSTEVEKARTELLNLIDPSHFASIATLNVDLQAHWTRFRDLYSGFYADRHNSVMGMSMSGDKLKGIMGSDEWFVFESLSSTILFDWSYVSKAKSIIREIRQLSCNVNTNEILLLQPYCDCTFSLMEADRLTTLPDDLWKTIGLALTSLAETINQRGSELASLDGSVMHDEALKKILSSIRNGEPLSKLGSQEIRQLKLAAERISTGSFKVNRPNRAPALIGHSDGGAVEHWGPEIEAAEVVTVIEQ